MGIRLRGKLTVLHLRFQLQLAEVALDLVFQGFGFLEEVLQPLRMPGQLLLKRLRRDSHILDLDLKILPGGEGVVFGGDVVVGDGYGEIVDRFLGVEGLDDAVFFFAGEEGLLVFAVLDLGAELGSVDEDDVAVVGVVEEDDVVEPAQAAAALGAVGGVEDGVALDDVGDGVDEAVEDEVEPVLAS